MFQGVGGFRGMFVADLGGEVAMGLRRLPTLANHCAQRASFALLQGKWIEFRELTYMITVLKVPTYSDSAEHKHSFS